MARPTPNAPCTCGSGKKFKRCCGATGARTREAPPPPVLPRGRAAGRLAAAAVLILVVTFLAYGGVLDAPFLYDDILYVQENPSVRRPGNPLLLWGETYPPGRPEIGLYRPLTALTYVVDQVRGGGSPKTFHRTNVLLHALAALLLFFLLTAMGSPPSAALLGGVLFALHPVRTEAVSWVVGRAEVLACLLTLAAVLSWIRFRGEGRRRWLVLTGICYFLALSAKETAAPLPAVLLLGDLLGVFPPRPAPGTGDPPRPPLSRSLLLLPHLVPVGVFGIYSLLRLAAIGSYTPATSSLSFSGAAPGVRHLSALNALGRYLQLTLWPADLRVHWHDVRSASLDPRVVAGLVALAGLAAATLLLRRRGPRASFWSGWFLLFLLPFTNLIIPTALGLSERVLYIASSAAPALVCLLVETASRRADRRLGLASLAAACGLALLWGWGTVSRNRDWADEERFWRREYALSPQNAKVTHNLAALMVSKGRSTGDRKYSDEALAVLEGFQRGLELSSGRISSDRAGLLVMHLTLLVEREEWDVAIPRGEALAEFFRQYPEVEPYANAAEFYTAWGDILSHQGREEEAAAAYSRVLREQPARSRVLFDLANILKRRGKSEEAVALYRRSIQAKPGVNSAYVNLALLLNQLGRRGEALEVLAAMERNLPDTAEDGFYRGAIAKVLGDRERALRWLRRAVALAPQHLQATRMLADLERTGGSGP